MSGDPTTQGHEPSDASKERIAGNESVFRDVNERIADGRWPGEPDGPVAFRCECGSLACNQLIEVPLAVYERVRSDPRHFVLLPGHEIPEVEVIVDAGEGYAVVEKIGVAGEVAEANDPR